MEIRNFNFSYKNKSIFDQLDLSFEKGKLNVLVGPNGSGKSTLFDCIAGINGDKYQPAQDKSIAYKLQKNYLLPDLSVKQTIDLYQSMQVDPRQKQFLEPLFQKVISPNLANKMGRLSGGQQQLVLNYLILSLERDIYLLDEPGNNLDSETKKLLYAVIFEMVSATSKLFIVSEHDLGVLDEYMTQVNLLELQ